MQNHLKKHPGAMAARLSGLVVAAMLLVGCATPPAVQSESPAKKMAAPVPDGRSMRMASAMQSDAGNGSLWVENAGSLNEMFINAKARRVGDIVTIRIVESSCASNKASTDTDRTTAMNVGLTSFFNLEDHFPSTGKFFNPFTPAQGSYESEFEGSGTTVRSGALEAYISARIVQILPNGNFFIEGNREVRVNNENQVITLTGVVRPRDISGDNVIQSTYIADARISYSGSGIVNDQQRPGWLIRILDNIWPF
jgi:flagellar L-ring protein precursor FlgH